MNEISTTDGPQGTVTHKTKSSLAKAAKQGDGSLKNNIRAINPAYGGFVDLTTLLTTHVENLHAVVSHFKHETFSVLQYAQNFGTFVKESMKRTTKWSAK